MSKRSAMERFLPKVDIKGADECWPWIGGMGSWGYGSFWMDGRTINSSRAAYLLLQGHVRDDQVVCHSCDNPRCCNPSHLWVGSQGDNVRDCNGKGRAKGTFSNGHTPLTRSMTKEQIAEAKKLYLDAGVSQTEIGRRMGFHSSVISRAVRK